jgi:hypothetical protein
MQHLVPQAHRLSDDAGLLRWSQFVLCQMATARHILHIAVVSTVWQFDLV